MTELVTMVLSLFCFKFYVLFHTSIRNNEQNWRFDSSNFQFKRNFVCFFGFIVVVHFGLNSGNNFVYTFNGIWHELERISCYEPHVGLNHNNQIASNAIASMNHNLFY